MGYGYVIATGALSDSVTSEKEIKMEACSGKGVQKVSRTPLAWCMLRKGRMPAKKKGNGAIASSVREVNWVSKKPRD